MRRGWWGRLLLLVLAILLLQQRSAFVRSNDDDGSMLAYAIRQSLQSTASCMHLSSTEAELRVADAHVVRAEDLGFTAYAVKILEPQEEIITAYWYDAEGHATAEREAFDARAAAYEARYGHLSRTLHARLSEASAADPIPVAIWAEQALGADAAPPSLPVAVYLPLVLRSVGGSCGSAVDCIVRFIEDRGYGVDYVSTEAPVVYASLPVTLINELQAQSYVAAVYDQAANWETLYSAARTTAAHYTWSRGITGSGVKVAVVEVPERCGTGGSRVASSTPYVSAAASYRSNDQVSDHATIVAGVIASTHPRERGIAYGATILSANARQSRSTVPGFESDIIAATDWAIKAGADVINASFGTPCRDRSINSQDKYFDWVVWEQQKTVVAAAGNLAGSRDKPAYCPWYVNWPYCPTNYNVCSPGKAYNVISVGAKDDKNTAEVPADTKDDQFSHFSLYVDPETASSNRLKPEVVAVGEKISSTIPRSPWIGEEASGTSVSAPIVAGQAALMIQRASWLRSCPEALKAGVMATARWTELKDDADPNGQASMDKMGVGGVDATAADNSLINGRIQGLHLRQSDFRNGYYDISFEVTVPERIRVIIVWSSHPKRISITDWVLHDRLESDFDLTVRAPNGEVFGSFADEANYEIVEFEAPVTGTYRARIHLSRWDNSSMVERVGFAWYSGGPLP